MSVYFNYLRLLMANKITDNFTYLSSVHITCKKGYNVKSEPNLTDITMTETQNTSDSSENVFFQANLTNILWLFIYHLPNYLN